MHVVRQGLALCRAHPQCKLRWRTQTTTLPNFKVTGKLHTATCPITMPFTGELTVEHCDMKVKSIELQLVRVETCGTELNRAARQLKGPSRYD